MPEEAPDNRLAEKELEQRNQRELHCSACRSDRADDYRGRSDPGHLLYRQADSGYPAGVYPICATGSTRNATSRASWPRSRPLPPPNWASSCPDVWKAESAREPEPTPAAPEAERHDHEGPHASRRGCSVTSSRHRRPDRQDCPVLRGTDSNRRSRWAVPSLDGVEALVDLTSHRQAVQVAGEEDRLHGPAELGQCLVGRMLHVVAGERYPQDRLGFGGSERNAVAYFTI